MKASRQKLNERSLIKTIKILKFYTTIKKLFTTPN